MFAGVFLVAACTSDDELEEYVERPVEDGGLRFSDGRCVFLRDDMLCKLHAAFGMESKPLTCQQFPFVATGTESGTRAGIDPSCAHAWQTWQDGPEVTANEHLKVRDLERSPPRCQGGEAQGATDDYFFLSQPQFS